MNRFLIILLVLIFTAPVFSSPAFESKIPEEDNLVETTLKDKNIEKPYIHLEYNYEDLEAIPLRVSIKERIKSEKDLYEGQVVEFIVQKSVYENNKGEI